MTRLTVSRDSQRWGGVRPEYGADIRSHRVRQHIVIYRATKKELAIVRILHVRRDIESELGAP